MQKNKKDYISPKAKVLLYPTDDIIRTSLTATTKEYKGFHAEWIAGVSTNDWE